PHLSDSGRNNMERDPRARRIRILVAAAAATIGVVFDADGGVSLDATSSAKLTHTADISNGSAQSSVKFVVPLPDSGSIYPASSYQYGSKTLSYTTGGNTATTTATGSVGAVTNSMNIGFTLASGSGITQDDPSGKVFTDYSQLKFAVTGTWDVTTGGYGGGAYSYIAFSIASTVPTGGSAQVRVNLKWTDPDNGNATY